MLWTLRRWTTSCFARWATTPPGHSPQRRCLPWPRWPTVAAVEGHGKRWHLTPSSCCRRVGQVGWAAQGSRHALECPPCRARFVRRLCMDICSEGTARASLPLTLLNAPRAAWGQEMGHGQSQVQAFVRHSMDVATGAAILYFVTEHTAACVDGPGQAGHARTAVCHTPYMPCICLNHFLPPLSCRLPHTALWLRALGVQLHRRARGSSRGRAYRSAAKPGQGSAAQPGTLNVPSLHCRCFPSRNVTDALEPCTNLLQRGCSARRRSGTACMR